MSIEKTSTFDEFIEHCTDTIEDIDGVKSFVFNQLDYLTVERGNILVDFVGRFEHFEREVREVLNRLGIHGIAIPYENRTQHAHYSQYYTERTKKIVTERYARDIHYFGYSFDGRRREKTTGIWGKTVRQPDEIFLHLDVESNPPIMEDRRAILVLGMHRSGTSALTAVLGILGADLPQNLMPGVPGENDLGYFESMDLYNAHEKLLRASDSWWDDPTPLDLSRLSQNIVENFRTKALEVLERDFSQSQLFVLKDPRMCRLVPLWLELLQEVRATPLVVLPIRNPLEIAASLQKRDGMIPPRAFLLYLRHVLEAERNTRGITRSVVSYSDLLANWRTTVQKIASDLGLTWPDFSEEQQASIEKFLSERWRHHNVDDSTLFENAGIPKWIKRTYRTLMSLADGSDDRGNRKELDEVWSLLSDADQLFGMVLTDETRRFKASRQTLEDSKLAMESEIRAKEEENAKLREALTTSREELAGAEEANKSLREELAETKRNLMTAEQEALAHLEEIAVKSLELDAVTQRIHVLEASLSWKVTAPLRFLTKITGL